MSKCKEFTSNFQRLASAIPELTDEEAFRILIRQNPHYLAQKLTRENNKKEKPPRYEFLDWKVKVSRQFMDLCRQSCRNPPSQSIKLTEHLSLKFQIWTITPNFCLSMEGRLLEKGLLTLKVAWNVSKFLSVLNF